MQGAVTFDGETRHAAVDHCDGARLELPAVGDYVLIDDDLGVPEVGNQRLHRAVAGSPARLIGVSLPDVAGDRRAQNQPGTDQEYPNWRVPMTDADGKPILLEDLLTRPDLLDRIVAAVVH